MNRIPVLYIQEFGAAQLETVLLFYIL